MNHRLSAVALALLSISFAACAPGGSDNAAGDSGEGVDDGSDAKRAWGRDDGGQGGGPQDALRAALSDRQLAPLVTRELAARAAGGAARAADLRSLALPARPGAGGLTHGEALPLTIWDVSVGVHGSR